MKPQSIANTREKRESSLAYFVIYVDRCDESFIKKLFLLLLDLVWCVRVKINSASWLGRSFEEASITGLLILHDLYLPYKYKPFHLSYVRTKIIIWSILLSLSRVTNIVSKQHRFSLAHFLCAHKQTFDKSARMRKFVLARMLIHWGGAGGARRHGWFGAGMEE